MYFLSLNYEYTTLKKEDLNLTRKDDAIEVAILEFLKARSDGAMAGRIRADKYVLKSLEIEELEEYLSVLVAEGKIGCDGNPVPAAIQHMGINVFDAEVVDRCDVGTAI